jgi:hypothetical protein
MQFKKGDVIWNDKGQEVTILADEGGYCGAASESRTESRINAGLASTPRP